MFGGHVRLVFTLVLGIFIACVIFTLTSFAEMPLDILASAQAYGNDQRRRSSHYKRFAPNGQQESIDAGGDKGVEAQEMEVKQSYGSFDDSNDHVAGNPFIKPKPVITNYLAF